MDIFNPSLFKLQTFNKSMYTLSIIYIIAGLLVSDGINSIHVPRHFMEVFPKDGYRGGKFPDFVCFWINYRFTRLVFPVNDFPNIVDAFITVFGISVRNCFYRQATLAVIFNFRVLLYYICVCVGFCIEIFFLSCSMNSQ